VPSENKFAVAARGSGKFVEDLDELVHEGLAFRAKQKMLEVLVREVSSPTGVAPEQHGRYV